MWVSALVAAAVFEVIISFIFFRLKPRFEYLSSRARIIFNNAKGLSILSLLNYLTENIDNVLIGKISGNYGLGIYQPTYSLSHEANYEITKSIHHSTLPVYVKIESEPARLRRAFLRTLFTTMPFIVLTSLPLLLFPELAVRLLFGEQWLDSIPLMRWLVLAGLLQGFLNLGYSLFIARQKYALMNIQLACTFVLLVVLISWLGPQYGLTGAVIAVLLSRVLPLPITFLNIKRQLKPATEKSRYA
jgi:PST family polysaccharide transporter